VGPIASLIASAESGDPSAADALFAALYAELHRLAGRQLAGGRQTLGTTTLLHEAYLKVSRREGLEFPDRARFMAYAARVMRRLVIDHARRRQARKRGGQFEITSLLHDPGQEPADAEELALIDAALEELARADPALAELVNLKFFGGFSFEEIAAMRGVAERTVQRHWEKARLYLHQAVRSARDRAETPPRSDPCTE
jgi:RNA polymerase sigma factor (TIGR02999 family)